MNSTGKYVVISGCDSGFGYEVAVRLISNSNFQVFAGCLTDQGIKNLNNACSNNPRLTALKLDITKEDQIALFLKAVQSKTDVIHALINNAGISRGFLVDATSMEDYRLVMEVNFFGHVAMTKAFIPLLTKTRGNRLINVASSAGLLASAGMSAYASSKFALEAFSDSFRRELKPFGVHCSILEPAFMRTNIVMQLPDYEKTFYDPLPQEKKERWGVEIFRHFSKRIKFVQAKAENPQYVVNDILHAIEANSPKARYKSGFVAKTLISALSIAPTWIQDLFITVSDLGAPIPLGAKLNKLS